jgi:GT2 family glycosyltransferase
MSRPVCSVCIANYNGMAVIGPCLESVLAQDLPHPIEVLVHDDNSTDGSADWVRSRFPEVRLIASRENVGFCKSNHRMAHQARGEYLLFLNNDAELFADAIRCLLETAKQIEAICSLPQYHAETGALIDQGENFDFFLNPRPNLDSQTDPGMVIGACLWIRRSLWEELGGFPLWFHTLAEDMYLCCAARLRGVPVKVPPVSGYRHWVGKSLGGGKVVRARLATSIQRRRLSERNKSFVMALCYPGLSFYLLFPLHLGLLLAEGMAVSLIKRKPLIFKTIYLGVLSGLWREKRRNWRQRRVLQSQRRIPAKAFFQPFDWIPHKLRMLIRHGMPALK